jgi:hypothetical protein
MRRLVGWSGALLLLAVYVGTLPAQQPKEITTTITEPGVYSVDELYKASDTVAVVEITAADAESYSIPIYKARLVMGLKGATTGQTIFYGRFIGDRLGSQYVVFLKNAKEPAIPIKGQKVAFGSVHYGLVFDEGYSSMETSFQCVFPEGLHPSCDDAVRICTDYIKLPTITGISPAVEDVHPFGCRWVRKWELISVLGRMVK